MKFGTPDKRSHILAITTGSSRVLWDALNMNNFYFLFLLFSDFIGILFSFSFSFLLNNEEACDKEVT